MNWDDLRFLLAQRPLGQFSEARYGAPHIIIGHATLLGMLLKSCAEHGVAISDNRGCTGVSQANGRVLAAFGKHGARDPDPTRHPQLGS